MKITVNHPEYEKNVELYSKDGIELIGNLWVKLCTQYKLTHEITWLGVPIIQLSEDIVMMQELIWKVRPDVIIECGIAHGGSALFYASILELIGKGFVIGVDNEIRKYNEIAIKNHPLSHRVVLIEGSSISPQVIKKIKQFTKKQNKIMVILDSNHSKEHVLKELEIYQDIVTPGSYLVAMDGAQEKVADIPNGKPEWKEDNPLAAINTFIKKNKNFQVDGHYCRLKVTANPNGFLKKIKEEENRELL